jgi:hypothetical protein
VGEKRRFSHHEIEKNLGGNARLCDAVFACRGYERRRCGGGGDGSAEDPLQIGTEEELLAFAKRVTDAENGDEALCAILMNDITVENWAVINSSGMEYSSIGKLGDLFDADSASPYTGVFDGNGKTLSLSRSISDGEDLIKGSNIALFHTIGAEGVVKNLDLSVDFSGNYYIAGVAAKNYGAIQNVTVNGTIQSTVVHGCFVGGVAAKNCGTIENAIVDGTIAVIQDGGFGTYAGGIVGANSCIIKDGILVPGKIINCINKASIKGSTLVGGIAGSFLGEMYHCGNVGTVSGLRYFGGLLAVGKETNPSGSVFYKRFIVSDCYNAGEVVLRGNYDSFAGLFGNPTGATDMSQWRDAPTGTYPDFQVSNVFSYGNTSNQDGYQYGFIIAAMASAQNSTDYSPYDITQIFSNTYYREKIGWALFLPSNLNGADNLGTDLVKTVIHAKSTDDFASAEMAAALNNGRTGANAPWEYVDGNDYPTLKFERAGYDPNDEVVEPEPDTYALTVNAGANGLVSSAGGNYGAGAEITVTAAAYPGYRFASWTADGISLELAAANPLTFEMPANVVTLTAIFEVDEPIPSSIDAVAGYGGAISFSEGKYSVSATSNGYVIDEIWVDGVKLESVQGETTFELTTVPTRSIFATFGYTINFPNPANGSLSVSRGANDLTSGSIVYAGEILTVTATPETGFELDTETTVFSGLTPVEG